MYTLSEIVIGDYQTSPVQDGISLTIPASTPVLAASDGIVHSIGTIPANGEPDKFYLILSHEGGFLTHYSPLDSLVVISGEKVLAGQQLGIVSHTLEFAIQETKGLFIDPFGPLITWSLKGLTEPIKKPILTEITLSPEEHASLATQAENYRHILGQLSSLSLFDRFIEINKLLPLDLDKFPLDTTGKHTITDFVMKLASEYEKFGQAGEYFEKRLKEQEQEITHLRKVIQENTTTVQRLGKWIQKFIFLP